MIFQVCAIDGKCGDGTPFSKTICFNEIRDRLEEETSNKKKYHKDGSEVMYNGFSGNKLSSPIFIGPTYYQRLKHLVDDKSYARPRGAVTLLVRQPQAGRSRYCHHFIVSQPLISEKVKTQNFAFPKIVKIFLSNSWSSNCFFLVFLQRNFPGSEVNKKILFYSHDVCLKFVVSE